MRIVWIVYKPVGFIFEKIYKKEEKFKSGTWIIWSLKSIMNRNNKILIVTSTSRKDVTERFDENTIIKAYNVSGKINVGDVINKYKSIEICNSILEFKPDLIHFWGTESGFISSIYEELKHSRKIVSIQGIVNSIDKYNLGYLTKKELCHKSFLNRLKYPLYKNAFKRYSNQKKAETRMLETANYIFTDSDWSKSYCLYNNSSARLVYYPLKQNDIFYKNKWMNNNDKRIFTIAPRGPYKGIHILIKALVKVKEVYPNFILSIPGVSLKKNVFLENPYYVYLKNIINTYNLKDNIRFLPTLSQEELVEELMKSSIFVMPSIIENQSASLREAMALGVPCISSYCGCVNDVLLHKKTGLLYRYEEYETLAYYILLLFKNNAFAYQLGENGSKLMHNKFYNKQINLNDLYLKCIGDDCND